MTDRLPPLIPHLCVVGAADAIEFYKKAFGATEVMRVPAEDGKRLMHAHLIVNSAPVFLVDDFPEHRGQHGGMKVFPPKEIGGTPVVLHLEVKNCDESVKRAADAGATVTMPPWDAFWGARYAQVADPFGHAWSFAHPLPAK
ncbi:MAG: VOC family protein [Pseudomonadota bacterium]